MPHFLCAESNSQVLFKYIQHYKSPHSVYSGNEHVAHSAKNCDVLIKSPKFNHSSQLKLVFDSADVNCDI